MSAIILSASDLSKEVVMAHGESQERLVILDSINLEVAEGESLAIVGESGSGKTTLLGILAGLDLPSSGRVVLCNEELTTMGEEQRALMRGRYVGFVFQSFQLLESLTALENVMLPGELRGDADPGADARELLQRVGLDERLHHYPRQLSGGEQQRVAVARAFASKPRVLFADEPTGNLDTATGERVIDLLFELNQEFGTTLVLVTHDVRLADRCQSVLELRAGRRVPRPQLSTAS